MGRKRRHPERGDRLDKTTGGLWTPAVLPPSDPTTRKSGRRGVRMALHPIVAEVQARGALRWGRGDGCVFLWCG